jgi:hypothetical protein
LVEAFPKRGTSGHVSLLQIEIEHLPGEIVFPAGLSFRADAQELQTLKDAHFFFPAQESALAPILETEEAKDGKGHSRTKVVLPLIPLPPEAGRKELTLPRFRSREPADKSTQSARVRTQ